MKNNILLLIFPLFLTACGGKEQPAAEAPAEANRLIPVKTAPVEHEQLVAPIRVSGMVATSNEARPAFKTGGVIDRILVDEGDMVRPGQLLATLNLTEINAQVQQAAEAVEKARRDLQRAKNLYADSVATLEQVQDATTGLTVAEQNLEMARFNRSYSEIRAPFGGKVVRRIMNEGEVAGPGMPVFYLLSNARQDWVVRAGLSDRDWARLRVGNHAEIRFDAYPGQAFPARVSQLADVGNPQSGTFDAEFAFAGAVPRLAVGLVASVTAFPAGEGEQTVIPIDALLESNGSSAVVYVLDDSNRVRRTTVTVGYLLADKAVILDGLQDAAAVVTAGAPYLEDGFQVQIVQ